MYFIRLKMVKKMPEFIPMNIMNMNLNALDDKKKLTLNSKTDCGTHGKS